jgi:hypothetical protein
MTEQLSAEDLTTLTAAAAILSRLSPQARLDVQAAALEAERQAEQVRSDEGFRERDERCAKDPEFLARCAEVRQMEADERRQKLDRLKALARQSGPSDPRPPQQGPAGWTMVGGDSPRFHCHECGSAIWGNVTLCGAHTLCETCDARRQLKCDQCSASKDVICTRCTDGHYRCPSCMADPKIVGNARAGQPLGSLLTSAQLESGRFR